MKVLVAGGAGFLGAHLVRHCLGQGDEVAVLDSLEPRLGSTLDGLAEVMGRISFVKGSLLDEATVAAAVRDRDVVYNCAAQSSHPISLRDPVYCAEINCIGNLRLLEALRRVNPAAVVAYPSSSTVVGKAAGDVIDEDHAEKPLDVYSAHKGVAEKYYRVYHRVHDLKTVVIRFANLYGPYGKGAPDFGFVNHFIHEAWNRRAIRIFGDGAQTRNVMHASDAAGVLRMAALDERLRGETWFAAHDEHPSVREIAETIVRVLGRGRVENVAWPEERKRIEIEKVRINSGRLRLLTGWRPSLSFEEGLERTRAVLEAAR